MARITGTRYVLAVHSVERSSRFYQDVLGFTEYFADGDFWRFLERDGFIVMMGECPDSLAPSDLGDHSYFAYWDVDDADALHEDWKLKGAKISEPEDMPWGQREFSLHTPDGHRIRVGQALNSEA